MATSSSARSMAPPMNVRFISIPPTTDAQLHETRQPGAMTGPPGLDDQEKTYGIEIAAGRQARAARWRVVSTPREIRVIRKRPVGLSVLPEHSGANLTGWAALPRDVDEPGALDHPHIARVRDSIG